MTTETRALVPYLCVALVRERDPAVISHAASSPIFVNISPRHMRSILTIDEYVARLLSADDGKASVSGRYTAMGGIGAALVL